MSYLALFAGLVVLGVGQGAGHTLMFGAATPADQQVGGAAGLAVLVVIAGALPTA